MLNPDPHSSVDMSSAEPLTTQHANPHAGRRPSRIDSVRLMQGTRELLIAHAGEEYRLRVTRNDKLILTK